MEEKKAEEKYKCNVCGKEVVMTKPGEGVISCCGEDMELTINTLPA